MSEAERAEMVREMIRQGVVAPAGTPHQYAGIVVNVQRAPEFGEAWEAAIVENFAKRIGFLGGSGAIEQRWATLLQPDELEDKFKGLGFVEEVEKEAAVGDREGAIQKALRRHEGLGNGNTVAALAKLQRGGASRQELISQREGHGDTGTVKVLEGLPR